MVKIPPQTFQSDYSIRNNSAARLITFSLSPLGSMSAAHYDAAGRLTSDTLGNGETETWTYNNRGWSVSSTSTLNSTNIYSYNITSFAPDGDVLAASDSVNGNWTYSYDPFNRLVGSNQNSSQAVYSYVYDRFGNRWQQNGPNSMQLTFTGNDPSSPQNNNRMDGYTYDAAGNLLNDGTHQYFYDAENHLIQMDGSSGYCSTGSGTAATACYFYDAAGHRVRNTAVPDCVGLSGLAGGLGYIYDLSGRWVAGVATDANNDGPCAYEVYAGNRHLVHGSSPWTYIHSDWLGTERVRYCTGTTGCGGAGGTFQDNCTSLPFGDGLTCTNALNNKHFSHGHLTGKEHDPESGLDNFGARFNSSSFGRFMSPDPAGMMAVDIGSPQTLNRYAYVLNSPLSFTDPFGLDCVYLNSSGTSVEKNGIDQNSNSKDCGKTGGYWVDGTVTHVNIDSNATTISLQGTTNGAEATSASYRQDEVVVVGEYNNVSFNPYNHIALGIVGHAQMGQNPHSDVRFLWNLINWGPNVSVPGAIKPQRGGKLLNLVRIRATGMQAQMLGDAIGKSMQNPPPYTVFGTTGCDCGTWAQMMLGDAGINAGPPAPLPDVLMEQLNQLYPQQSQPPQW